MIAYTPEAVRQVEALVSYYEERQRGGAIRALLAALEEAESKIEGNPSAGLAAPRPYPSLARQGRAWVKAGRYWIAYSMVDPPTILAVFFETANVPSRL